MPYAFESLEVYKETFDLNAAICEGHRLKDIQERKQAEIERRKKEEEERKLLEEQAKVEVQEKETFDLNAAICEGHRLKDIQERKQAEIERRKKEEEERKLLEEQAKVEVQEKEAAATDEEKASKENTANTEIEEAKVREIRSWIGFKAHLTRTEAIELSKWLRERNIVFKALQ